MRRRSSRKKRMKWRATKVCEHSCVDAHSQMLCRAVGSRLFCFCLCAAAAGGAAFGVANPLDEDGEHASSEEGLPSERFQTQSSQGATAEAKRPGIAC